MRSRISFFAAMLLVPLGASAQPLIQSQEGIALQNEILQLQQQVQQLQSQHNSDGGSAVAGSAAPAAPSANNPLLPSLLTQVQQLQSQIQTLNGQVSELQHQVTVQDAQTQQQIGDLKFQIANGPAAGTATTGAAGTTTAATPAAPQAPAPAPVAAAVPKDPRDALKMALQAYEQRDYSKAATIAQDIVTNHKSAAEAYRAQYLVAQSEAALGSAQNAAVAYYNTYGMNKTGTYAPRALLGLASALADLRQNPQACETISSLNSQFTNPSAGMKHEIDAVAARAHCS